MENKNIWALFSVANDYNQPDNNLCAYWFEKPTISQLAKVLGYSEKDEIITKLLEGVSIRNGETYRLEQVNPDTEIK